MKKLILLLCLLTTPCLAANYQCWAISDTPDFIYGICHNNYIACKAVENKLTYKITLSDCEKFESENHIGYYTTTYLYCKPNKKGYICSFL